MYAYQAQRTIASPPEVVWAVLMDPATWDTWWGGGLDRVEPRWTVGALMHWAMGGPSEIRVLMPAEKLEFAGASGAPMAVLLEPGPDGSTEVTCGYDPTGSRMRVTDPRAVQEQQEEKAEGLKRFVEAHAHEYAAGAVVDPAVAGTADRLLADLVSDVARVRVAAAKELGSAGGPRAVDPLVDALTDSEEEVRRAAAEALDGLGWQPHTTEERTRYLVAQQRWAECAALGPEGIGALARVNELHAGRYTDDPVSHAHRAIKACGPEAVEPLIETLGSPNLWTAVYAADLLGDVVDPRALEALRARTGRDSDEHLRKAAVAAIELIAPGQGGQPAPAADASPTAPAGPRRRHWWRRD